MIYFNLMFVILDFIEFALYEILLVTKLNLKIFYLLIFLMGLFLLLLDLFLQFMKIAEGLG